MKSDSWEFLLYDEKIPTVFGFQADMALLRFRERLEESRESRESNEIMEDKIKKEELNERTSTN